MKLRLNENIRRLRREAGMTQEQLAEAVGVTVGAVSKWESGLSNPDINMLPALAEFFEISVDVLLGYTLTVKTAEIASKQIHSLLLSKKYDEGSSAAENALQKFPNNFDIVYHSARLYHLCGIERKDPAALQKALELYNRACSLMAQNEDDSISLLLLRVNIGEVYVAMDNIPLALQQLKKYNWCGISNGIIGFVMSQNEKYSEALPFLSKSLLDNTLGLFQTAVGFANCFGNTGDNKSAVEILFWMYNMLDGLKYPGKVSYIDRAQVMLLACCAQVTAEADDLKSAEAYLRRAAADAVRFDSAPAFSAVDFKFYSGEDRSIGDDFGDTAIQGIKKLILSDAKTSVILKKLWMDITNEEI